MSFGFNTPNQRPGPIFTRDLSRTFKAVGDLLRMTVGAGLSIRWVHGAPVISLDGDFRLYDALTTSEWPARSGSQMGLGTFKFQAADSDGKLSDAGLPEYEGFNYVGGGTPVASGSRGIVAKVNGTWRLVSAECVEG